MITYYTGTSTPAFLLTMFGKNEKANLTKAERNALAGLTSTSPTASPADQRHNDQGRRQDEGRIR